jgi:hypothetical protein
MFNFDTEASLLVGFTFRRRRRGKLIAAAPHNERAAVRQPVTSVDPNAGPADGGTSVTITGGGFTGAIEVDFGGIPAADFVVDSDTSITATSPAASAGTVDVAVTTLGGTSAASASDQFTYG